jgi:hypothetical protein
MVEDLIVNYKLIGLTKNKLKTILGSPDFNEDLEISYSLDIDYGTDIDPVYHRYLTFELTKDSVVKKYQIKEWRK